jgi:hypothetical protein
MIDKAKRARSASPGRAQRLRKNEPLEVDLTVSFRFGDEPGDRMTPIRDRRVPMVDSVFKNRDRILRAFVRLLVKTGLSSPKVVGQVLPLASRPRRTR